MSQIEIMAAARISFMCSRDSKKNGEIPQFKRMLATRNLSTQVERLNHNLQYIAEVFSFHEPPKWLQEPLLFFVILVHQWLAFAKPDTLIDQENDDRSFLNSFLLVLKFVLTVEGMLHREVASSKYVDSCAWSQTQALSCDAISFGRV